jgi:integration host factor subunit alpha
MTLTKDHLVSGFGKFCVRKKRERRGRNPATGESMLLETRRAITFDCSG